MEQGVAVVLCGGVDLEHGHDLGQHLSHLDLVVLGEDEQDVNQVNPGSEDNVKVITLGL